MNVTFVLSMMMQMFKELQPRRCLYGELATGDQDSSGCKGVMYQRVRQDEKTA